jgi:thiol-disulfide isomerase/thioredoxin
MLPRPCRVIAALCLLALLAPPPARPAAPAAPSGPAAEKLAEANQLMERHRYDLAVDVFKKANKLAGGDCIDCLLGQARACNQIGAFADAIDSSRKVIGLTQDRAVLARAHNQLGLALIVKAKRENREDLAAAEQAFRKVLELSGGDFELARFNLGTTLLQLGRDAEGVALLKEFLEEQSEGVLATRARSLIENPRRAREDLAPGFTLVTLDGRTLSLDDLAGKVVLIDFWGTWCPPCREAIPTLKSLHGRLAGKEPFVVVGISVGTPKADLEKFIAANQMQWAQAMDDSGDLTELFGVRGYPTHLLIDSEGRIVYRQSGWGSRSAAELKTEVGRALRAAAKSARKAGP